MSLVNTISDLPSEIGNELLITTMLIGQEDAITPKFESVSLDWTVTFRVLLYEGHGRRRASITSSSNSRPGSQSSPARR